MQHPENDGSFVPTSQSIDLIANAERFIRRKHRSLIAKRFGLKALIYSGYCPASGVITPPPIEAENENKPETL